jgi:hypothetical protein
MGLTLSCATSPIWDFSFPHRFGYECVNNNGQHINYNDTFTLARVLLYFILNQLIRTPNISKDTSD